MSARIAVVTIEERGIIPAVGQPAAGRAESIKKFANAEHATSMNFASANEMSPLSKRA
jgi:hypothetical protein